MKLLTHALDHDSAKAGDALALRFLVTGECDGETVELTREEFRQTLLQVSR